MHAAPCVKYSRQLMPPALVITSFCETGGGNCCWSPTLQQRSTEWVSQVEMCGCQLLCHLQLHWKPGRDGDFVFGKWYVNYWLHIITVSATIFWLLRVCRTLRLQSKPMSHQKSIPNTPSPTVHDSFHSCCPQKFALCRLRRSTSSRFCALRARTARSSIVTWPASSTKRYSQFPTSFISWEAVPPKTAAPMGNPQMNKLEEGNDRPKSNESTI